MQKDGFKIPQIAILRNQEEVYVYTLVNSEVVKTPIEVVYQTNDYAVVSRGLKNGDKIITNNFKKIRPGAKVNEVGSK